MEKSCSSEHKGKRTLWGRTSVSENGIVIVLHINAGRIILQSCEHLIYRQEKTCQQRRLKAAAMMSKWPGHLWLLKELQKYIL